MIKLKRVYEPAAQTDGERYLVERLWPRGMKKEAAHLAGWLKELAPSPELHQWYGHDPEKWAEFRRRYQEELQGEGKQALLKELAAKAGKGTITLVFATREPSLSNAVVLRDLMEKIIGQELG